MPPSNEELFEMLMDLQADISALTDLMLEANPQLAAEFRSRADEHRKNFHLSRKDRLES